MGLLLSSPILLGAAIAIKCNDSGPVLFSQQRTGLGGRPFRLYKLRSMYVDAEHRKAQLAHLSEQDGPAFKIADDPRVTPVGRFLRRTSIDELPQLINVLKGEMSLVGPRPMDCREVAHFARWHRRRHWVTPGLTCIWQVHGRSRVTFKEWMRMDLGYLQRRGFLRDLMLLLQTVPAVLLRRGAC
jgi:lipopolysaccharide/colanic/teichoic acid biosynthesis glycosyltransferase